MAPLPEAYFPSLDKCFSGDVQLLTWKRAFLYTCDFDSTSDDAQVFDSFLSHPDSTQLLLNRATVFPSPSAKTKSDFENKTAAIHSETNAQASYNLKEIKADALWLSEKAGIDEINALRIVVLEWQSRPGSRLLGRFAEEEASSLKGAAGVDTFRVSLAGPSFAEIFNTRPGEEGSAAEFISERNRRLRLREIYLSERSHIVKTARKLLALFLDADQNTESQQQPASTSELYKLSASLFTDKVQGKDWHKFGQECIKAVQTRLSALDGQGGWLSAAESSQEIENLWRTTFVEELSHLLQGLFIQLQTSSAIPPADLVLSWLRLMADHFFLQSLDAPCEAPEELLLPLQGFVCLITLALLKLPLSIPTIIGKSQGSFTPDNEPYFLSKHDIGQIHELFTTVGLDAKIASPAAFSWGLILHTMGELALNDKETRELEQFHSAVDSFQSKTPHSNSGRAAETSLYEELLDSARTPQFSIENSIEILSSDVVKGDAFDTIISLAQKIGPSLSPDDRATNRWARTALLDLIRAMVLYMDYSPELVESLLAILTGPRPDSTWPLTTSLVSPSDPRVVFMKDEQLMNNIFVVARSRFPYETVPFLKLCRALLCADLVNEEGFPQILDELESMETFTQVVPDHFQGYETIREDEDANLVSLIQPLPMIDSTSRRQSPHQQSASNALIVTNSSEIPSATLGQIVSESRPAVVMWKHRYSCLSYLGSWLEEWNENGGYSENFGDDCVAETIWLFTDFLLATAKNTASNNDDSAARTILEMASDGLARQADIVSLIFDIFERNLQTVSARTGSEGLVDSTVACLHFIRALIAVLPSRVWPLLSRSSLLGADGRGGMLTAIISAMEVTSGDYPFLMASVRLFEAVADDAVSRAVLRRCPAGKAGVVSDWTAGVPSHIMRSILLNFVRIMVEVYNSNGNWRFNALEQKFEVNTRIAKMLEKILYYAFGTNDAANGKLESKATGVFSSSATYILDALRPQSAADLPFNPILRLIMDGLQTPSTIFLRFLTLVEKQVVATLELSARLLQAAQLTKQPPSLLEEQLFKATPVLVKIYSLHGPYQLPTLSLLNTLVTTAASDSTNEPPSLVGHLGAESSCLFLDVLSQFDKPLGSPDLQSSVWRLLSTLVSKRQQWLAVYILTGSSPRQSLKKAEAQDGSAVRGTPFLQMALDTLTNIDRIPPQTALSLLDFVSNAQEHWPWATPELRKHANFFPSLVNYVSKLNLSSLSNIDQIFATRVAAVVADICAVYLHSAKEARDQDFYKTLFPLVSWYAKDAVDVGGYNASLHANLKRNFESRYPGCKLDDFKRTPLRPRSLGPEYYYDIRLGKKLLSYDFAWAGSKNRGFAEEFERANLNLSLVEAQVSLLHSWKFFAVEHCADFISEREIQKSMAAVVKSCLQANASAVPKEAIFERIQQTRVYFAQNLLQRLVEKKAKGAEFFSLLQVVWESLRNRRSTYEDALVNDDSEYYRVLLNTLFLALQFHLDSSSRAAPEALNKKAELSSDLGIVVEIVKIVVAQGFRSLTAYLHDQPEKCTPKDFAIITAILQSSLQVKNVDRIYEHIVYHIADNDTVRHATSLFSWADQLAVAGDPVYGELSISFLAKLSTIPMLAEHLAVEVVLTQLSNCRLTNVLRQPRGFGPFDPVPRIYAIWSGGILPLCLNLLYHVIRTAPEVAAFLNQFEGQLKRASESFASARTTVSTSAHSISLSMASDAYTLALISFILSRLREAGSSIGVDAQAIQDVKWDKAQVKEDIEELLERRSNLRGRIVATNEKEVEMARQKPLKPASGAENRLEERVVGELKATLACFGGDES